VDSGSRDAIGIWGRTAGNGVNRFLIKNNLVQHFQTQGMYLRGNEGVGQDTDYTVTGNQILSQDGDALVLLLEAGSTATDQTDVCFDIGGTGTGGDPGLPNTIDLRTGGGNSVGVARDFAANSLRLRHYTPGGGNAGLTNYFRLRNDPDTITAVLSNLANDAIGGTAACAQPAEPPLP
jgi:hypothetical protein